MKLEDHGRLPQPTNVVFDPSTSTVVGVLDKCDILESKELHGYLAYGIKHGEQVISHAIIEAANINGVYRFRELWTHKDFRGKGYATTILIFMLRKLNLKLKLAKDEIVSNDSRGMIEKGLLFKRFKAYDMSGVRIPDERAVKMLRQLGKTNDELVLAEAPLDIELFSNKRKSAPLLGSYYVIAGMEFQNKLD